MFAVILVPVLLVTAYNASASASSAPAPKGPALQVYGERTPALDKGISYWNGLAGGEVLHYAGRQTAAAVASDPHTVAVTLDALPPELSGLTAGNVGQTALTITIDPRFMLRWVVYAHEFGHALGFGHDQGPGYAGVMSYATMWKPNPGSDQRLLSRFAR